MLPALLLYLTVFLSLSVSLSSSVNVADNRVEITLQMFPVRVTVETVRAHHCLSCAHDGHILVDTYAIVSGSTVLSQLVETVLSALGHPQLALNARGNEFIRCGPSCPPQLRHRRLEA